MIEVRQYLLDEWEKVRDVRLKALIDSPEAFSSSIEREKDWDAEDWKKRFEDRAWFLANDGDAFIGIAGSFKPANHPQGEYHLIGMWVAPEYRGTQTALLLVEAVKNYVRSIEGNKLSLLIVPENLQAQKFYEKVGFDLVRTNVNIEDNPAISYNEMSSGL